jgi:hypothetical protein
LSVRVTITRNPRPTRLASTPILVADGGQGAAARDRPDPGRTATTRPHRHNPGRS